MNKIFNFLFASLFLIGCVASASSVKYGSTAQKSYMTERTHDEMLELVRETEQERIPAIYVVIISEPEIITSTLPEK
jgi:hypothetical protein